jgi:hypothetical protein
VPHWLACGELLQHLLLVVTREGLHHSYFNMPVQVPELRVRLRALCGLSGLAADSAPGRFFPHRAVENAAPVRRRSSVRSGHLRRGGRTPVFPERLDAWIRKKRSREDKKENGYSSEAHLIYGRMDDPKWDYSHHLLPPISTSATYRLDSAGRGAQGFAEFAHSSDELTVRSKAPIYIYDRLGEPNKDMLEENLAFAESGDIAVSFSSGMAAVSGVLGILTGAGSEILRTRPSTDARTLS